MTGITVEKSKLDLRAPVLYEVAPRYTGCVASQPYARFSRFSSLLLAWVIAGTYGNPIDSFWHIGTNPLSIFVVLPIEIGLIAAQGLYQSGEKRCDYWNLVKTVSLAQVLLLVIGFLTHPNQFVSRSTYLLSWLLSISFVCAGRLCIDLLLKQLRKKGAIRYPTILICPPEMSEKASKLLEEQNAIRPLN
jgi:FlaA1/EpsC-like NDP-sugar epimerase